MAEKKKDDLTEIINRHKASGGVANLIYHFRKDDKKYEAGLKELRVLTSPEGLTRLGRYETDARAMVRKTIESYMTGKHLKNLKKGLKEGEEIPEHHKYGFAHFKKDEDKRKHASELLDDLGFAGIENMYGKKAAEAARKEFENGNDKHLRDFIEKYLLPPARGEDGQPMDSESRRLMTIDQLANTADIMKALDDDKDPLFHLAKTYSRNINPVSDLPKTYAIAIGSLAAESSKHHDKLMGAAKKELEKLGYEFKSNADRGSVIDIFSRAHKGAFEPEKYAGVIKPVEKKAA